MFQLPDKECLLPNYLRRNTAVDQINEFINIWVFTRYQGACHPRLSPFSGHSFCLISYSPIASSPILHANYPQSQLSLTTEQAAH